MSDRQDQDGTVDLTDRAVYAEWARDTVRYRDLDPNGHVNNGAINMFFEDGRVHFRYARMRHLSDDLLRGFAVVRFDAIYRGLVHFPGEVEIGTVVTRIGGSSFELGQGVFSGARCVATAEVVQVYFDPATGRSTRIPDALRDIFAGAMAPGRGTVPEG